MSEQNLNRCFASYKVKIFEIKHRIQEVKSFAEFGKSEIATKYFGKQRKNSLALAWTQIMICLWLVTSEHYWATKRYYFNHILLFLLSNIDNKPYKMGKQPVVFNMFTD